MKSFSSFTKQILPKSLIALAVYPFISSFLNSEGGDNKDDIHHSSLGHLKNLPTSSPEENHALRGFLAGQLSIGSLSLNYFTFLVVVLALDSIIKIILQFLKKFTEDREDALEEVKTPPKDSNLRRGIMRSVIVYTIMYCFCQALTSMFFCSVIMTSSSVCTTPLKLLFSGQSPDYRHLSEEIEPINDDYQVSQNDTQAEKISLSMGRVLSTLNLYVSHMVVTKDMKYAFVTLKSGGLKVIDISNLAAPNVVKTLALTSITMDYARQKFLYLSPDEKTLFVSCFEVLEILDISDPESPYPVGNIEDKKFMDTHQSEFQIRLSISFALSADSKTLFVGGLGLQTFDISNFESPEILDSQLTVLPIGSYFLLTIAATADRKTLWVANGTLDSYDVTDARNKKLINSFSTENLSVNSLTLSRDNKTAFGIRTIGTEKIQVAKLDIANSSSPAKVQSFAFDQKSLHPAFIQTLSQKERYLLITTDQGVIDYTTVVFDLVENRVLKDNQSLLAKMQTVAKLPRENFFLGFSVSKTSIFEFYKNFPNKEIFGLTDYPAWTMEMMKNYTNIELSQDGKYLFVVGQEDSKAFFKIYNFQRKNSAELISSSVTRPQSFRIKLSADLKRVALFTNQDISFIDISNLTAPFNYSEFKTEGYDDLEQIEFWPGSDIVFVLINRFRREGNVEELRVMNFSDPQSPKELWNLTLPIKEEQNFLLKPYQKRGLLFVIGSKLLIYNISNISNPVQISSVRIVSEETESVNFAEASHDFKTFFVETTDASSFHKLQIYDISDVTNPRFLSELILPMNFQKFLSISPLLTRNSRTLYFVQKKDILVVDVSNRNSPRFSGLHPIGDIHKEGIAQAKLSDDSRTIYLVTANGTMHAVLLQVPQTLYLNQEEFYIGQHYSENPMMLRLGMGEGEYELMDSNEYKVAKVGIVEVKVSASEDYATPVMTLLPSWASFDTTNKLLKIEPRKQVDLGSYTLFAIVLNKVSVKDFSFYDETKAKALLKNLVSLGYLDKQYYLKSEMDSFEDFTLPNVSEDQRKKIYQILNKAYVITCTTIKILPSLRIEKGINQLAIVSPNNEYVKVNLQLQNTTNAKFVKKYFDSIKPVITSGKSHLMIEGSLRAVNLILKNLTVDFENLETCGAEIAVVDEMNPAVSLKLNDIRDYFGKNRAPYSNPNPKKFLQSQIDSVPVYTGQYFTITLDQDTFLDDNNDNLDYKLSLKGGENNETLPSWLTFDGLTMKGTAPEQLFDRNIEFALVASNEFKKVDIEFRIHMKISSTFVAKLIMKYSPYVLTIIGLYIKANKIYNILGKRFYRHKKDFYVQIGKEIVIFPIAFIQEEKEESEIIWKHLVKKIPGNNLIVNDDEITGKQKILKLIKETVYGSINQKNLLPIYLRGADSRKKIINQLIINKLVNLQLGKKEEKPTKRAFDKVRDQWPELVNWDLKSGAFKTDIRGLYKTLASKESVIDSDLEENLISKCKGLLGVNLYLLSLAMEAHTFNHHCLERLAIRSDVQIKERTKKNLVQRFFKLDIESMNMNSQLQVNYGISCKFENDSLVFSGVPCENFRDKVLVIEIATRQHKILKEIWIHEGGSPAVDSVGVGVEAEEQHYEVF